MRHWLFIVLFSLIVAGCSDRCDLCGGTSESKNKPYAGNSEKKAPYHTTDPTPWILSGGCDTTCCTYFMTVTVWLHNPTSKEVVTDVTCKLLLGDSVNKAGATVSVSYDAATNTRKNVKVAPNSTKKVEIQHSVSADEPNRLVANCSTYFK